MIHGIDTSFLVALDAAGHPDNVWARSLLDELLAAGDGLALAPQVLAEYVHVMTDPRRFEKPLAMAHARARAEQWWNAKEVVGVFPRGHTVPTFFGWLQEHDLGRTRLLDTLLAATYLDNDISSVLTTTARDFRVFARFRILHP